jgi:hypothetical protein
MGKKGWNDTAVAGVHSNSVQREKSPMALTRDEVVSVLGPVDNATIAEIAATGTTIEELREAWAWFNSDEALMGQGRPLPGTRVASLIDILEPEAEE